MPKAGQTIKPLVRLPRDPAGCWLWLGPTQGGHPTKTWHGQSMPATRWIWSQLFGPIPPGLVITHTCGNRQCINPAHLKCTTQADANRAAAHVTLTPEDVREIRRAKATRMPQTATLLADRYGISPQTIRDIWRGSSWRRARPNHGPSHKVQGRLAL